jgi:cytochrome c553/sugar lactone lactonase YvrE
VVRRGVLTEVSAGLAAIGLGLALWPAVTRAEGPGGGSAGKPIDVSYREGIAGPVAGAYPAGTPIVRDFDNVQFPESTHFDADSGYLYVSNINGPGLAKDGNGWIGRVKPDVAGATLEKWAAGLNAPKGMRVSGQTLWVADIDELVGVDLGSGTVSKRLKPQGAKLLNDVAADSQGRLYVSDTFTDTIYRITGDEIDVFSKGEVKGPNGLLVDGGKLFVAALGPTTPAFVTTGPGGLRSIDLETKAVASYGTIADGHLDGVEKFDDDSYLVSDWPAGKIYFISKKGQTRVLIEGVLGAADLGYDPARKWVFIPRMGEDRVSIVDLAAPAAQAEVAPSWAAKWEQGRLVSKNCTACHGAVDNDIMPRIAGQKKIYLVKALTDFRTGARDNPLMTPMAKGLSEADVDAVATYYAARKLPPATPLAKASDAEVKAARAKTAICAACHGATGTSMVPNFPNLAAQHQSYLVKALNDFKSGARSEPTMTPMADPLTDADIAALAAFFASQRK